ncbi:MAG: hypothetical protein O3A93_13640 [Chloroflexi bacterium]|nr:hypothetical protein [Chloroflexota bacterium]
MPQSIGRFEGNPISLALQESWIAALAEWRTETIPERDGLLGDSEGDNAAHVLVRGELLQLIFDDDSINERIDGWAEATPLKHKCDIAIEAITQLAEVAGVPWQTLDWDEGSGFIVGSDSEVPAVAIDCATSAVRAFLNELKSFSACEAYRQTLEDVVDFVEGLGLPYRWLAMEIFMVYYARLVVPGFAWHYRDSFVVEDTSEDMLAPDVELVFRTLAGESVSQATERLKRKTEKTLIDLTRFQESLPSGRAPEKRAGILKTYTRWLYRHKVRGEFIRSIAREEFPGDPDRRKDVRGGIRRAEELLSLGR